MAGGSKSKNKGNAGERELCKLLGTAFNDSFLRSANSGAFLGGKNFARKANLTEGQIRGQIGDIIPPDEMKRFVIECKSYKEFAYHLLFDSNAMLDGWVGQVQETIDPGDFWIVAFKANRRPWLVAMSLAALPRLGLTQYCRYMAKDGVEVAICDLTILLRDHAEGVRELACVGL